MSAFNIFSLIFGGLLVLASGIALFFLYVSRPLHDAEIEGMRREGRFDGEPEYMQQFRITRAEFDLESNQRWTRRMWTLLIIGICLFVQVFVL